MILVGNQRGGARDLAQHLLKEENDHVRVHELRGFASDNLASALNESYAVSRGTKCTQFLFSLSINPPPSAQVSTMEFEATIDRAEKTLGLEGQPRAIVFHEKEGPGGTRRHAHAVWSRIDSEEMKAIQLSHTKRKLTALSREIFLERDWQMPRGLMTSEERDPRNFSFEEWSQAKRSRTHPSEAKSAIQECWAVSDSRAALAQALDSRGYKLAKGDRRAFVAVDMHGEIYAIARAAGVKTRDVRARLGELTEKDQYPSIDKRIEEFSQQIGTRLGELRGEEARARLQEQRKAQAERRELVERQRAERAEHDAFLARRWQHEAAERQARFRTGLSGLLDRITGKAAALRDQNIAEAHASLLRERAERDRLIFAHIDQRRAFDAGRLEATRLARLRAQELKEDFRRYAPIAPSEVARAQPSPAPVSAQTSPLTERDQRKADFKLRRETEEMERGRSPRRDLSR